MKLLTLFLGLTFTLSSYAQQGSAKDQITNAVTSFYDWYIGTTKSSKYSAYVIGVRDEVGNTKLDTKEYFKRLDSLGVVSPEFIDSEKKRFQPCSDHLKNIPWSEFSTAEDFRYEKECGFLYYYYWTNGQEPHDGVEVKKVTIDGKNAITEITLYFGNNKSIGTKATVWLSTIKNKWMITKIVKE